MSGAETIDAAEYAETIALLQDEIARLEAELLAREDAFRAPVADVQGSEEDHRPEQREFSLKEIDRLAGELAAREETIGLLLEQLRLVEEAEAASKAEWEQLARWLTEVEERVERQDRSDPGQVDERLETLRRDAEQARARHEQDRGAWAADRRKLEEQVARLEAAVATPAATGNSAGTAALAAVEAENRRLRERCLELETSSEAELASVREELARRTAERDEARGERQAVQDERHRERREYESAVAALRSQMSRAALATPEPSGTDGPAPDGNPALEADMRIRAFRQHLKEIHCHEAEVRNSQRLGTRLSRLWRKTSPG